MDWFFFFSFAQAAAAAQAGASVIQIFVGRLRVISTFICVTGAVDNIIRISYLNYVIFQDWARNHSDDPAIESVRLKGEDPGLALVRCSILL